MWVGHSTQVFGQTPVGLSLWKYFLDEMIKPVDLE